MPTRELLTGSTETLLLSLLAGEPMYGYQIVKELERRSGGYFRFKEGTLYPALHRLEREGLLEGRWQESPRGLPRRYYSLTTQGRQVLASRQEEWARFAQAMNLVVSPEAV